MDLNNFKDFLDQFNYEDPVKSSKDESDVLNSVFYVQIQLYISLFKELEPDFEYSHTELLRSFFNHAYSKDSARSYIREIIAHYMKTELPFKDDLKPVDTDNFPRSQYHQNTHYKQNHPGFRPAVVQHKTSTCKPRKNTIH